jgi:hypothetical protein
MNEKCHIATHNVGSRCCFYENIFFPVNFETVYSSFYSERIWQFNHVKATVMMLEKEKPPAVMGAWKIFSCFKLEWWRFIDKITNNMDFSNRVSSHIDSFSNFCCDNCIYFQDNWDKEKLCIPNTYSRNFTIGSITSRRCENVTPFFLFRWWALNLSIFYK